MRRLTPNTIRIAWLAVAVACAACLFALLTKTQTVAAAPDATRCPVLVELFTSEGCSSCPPADALLARLDAQQFVPGAVAIVLSEHVTYWDQQGWRDPYSLDAMTDRQHQYADRFGLDSVYTPQAVVNGAAEMVGNDERAVTRAVARAAASRGAGTLAIQDAKWSGRAIQFSVRAEGLGTADARLMAVLAQDSAKSSVGRGENAGRMLRHVAVVRVMREMGNGALDGRVVALKLPGTGSSAPMRLVVFAADSRSGHVLAAAEQAVKGPQQDPGPSAGALQATLSPSPGSH